MIPVNINAFAPEPLSVVLNTVSPQPSTIGIAMVNDGPITLSIERFFENCGTVGGSITTVSLHISLKFLGERLNISTFETA